MEDHFFVHFKAMNQTGEKINKFMYFRENEIKEAEAYIQDWLTTKCKLNCISEGAENGAQKEETFVCPAVTVPADLEKYNEQHVEGIDFLVEPIYNVTTARQFKNTTMGEYNLDITFTPMSDEMSAILTGVKESFDPRYCASVNMDNVIRFVNQLLTQGGLSKF